MSCFDTGVAAQELGLSNEWVSETIFTTLFVSFMLWTFSPFVFVRKRFYTAVIWSRLLMVLVGEHGMKMRFSLHAECAAVPMLMLQAGRMVMG